MRKKQLFFLLGSLGIIVVLNFFFQNRKLVEASNEATMEIMANEYGQVQAHQSAEQLTVELGLSENDQGHRYLVRVIDSETKEMLLPIPTTEYTEYLNETSGKWLTTSQFFKQEYHEKWIFAGIKQNQSVDVEVLVEQQTAENEQGKALTPIVKESFKFLENNTLEQQSNKETSLETTEQSTKSNEADTKGSTERGNEEQQAKEQDLEEETKEEVVRPFEFPALFSAGNNKQTVTPIVPNYTNDSTGVYPQAAWQPTGNETVLNHQGNQNGQWDGVTSWNGNPSNRSNSYIEYGGTGEESSYAIRKYARETATPGLYDVFLNVRGNVQKEFSPVDVVLVVDWSGSMNEDNRLAEVKRGVNSFVDTLDHSGIAEKINLGYIGYSSVGYNNGSIPLSSFNSVKNQIKAITPSTTQGGTFTQKALREAGEMLAEQNNHEKVIVLLTDGVPTYSYHVNKVFTEQDGSYYGTEFSDVREGAGNTSLLSRYYNVPDQNNREKQIRSTFTATIGEALALKERGIKIHGLGIQLQSDIPAGLSKADVETNMKKMVSTDESGQFYYESADRATDISDYLAKKAVHIAGTISNGKVIDPIAQPFVYEENTLTIKDVGKNAVAVMPTIGISGSTIQSNQLYLGKDQEIQIYYQVRIQTESKTFKPDVWYQMNEKTTLQPTADASTIVEFGVPSAKAPGVTLSFAKEWEEYDHDTSLRPDQITYEIKRTPTTDKNSWKTGFIQLNKPTNDTEGTWRREDIKLLSASNGTDYQENMMLPKFNNQGQAFNYQASNEMTVEGYEAAKVNDTTWKNTKKFTPFDLNITKHSSSGAKNLVGAVFELTGQSKTIRLIDNKDGSYHLPADVRLMKGETYTLTEVQAPDGHELAQKNTWKIAVSAEGKVTIDGQSAKIEEQAILLTIENPFKKIPLAIHKYTLHGSEKVHLAGATFELQKKDAADSYRTVATKVSELTGLAQFTVEEPGEYRMVETKGPVGYDTIAGNYEWTIDQYGTIHYEHENVEVDPQWTLQHQNHLKPFNLTVYKKQDNGQSLKGASFKLEGEGSSVELPQAGESTDTFTFENLQPGSYTLTETKTPDGYQGLKKPVLIVVKEDGTVTVDGAKQESGLVAGDENNQITLTITNQVKVPLPETGGMGRIWFYLAGFLAISSTCFVAFFKKQRKGVA